MFLLPHSIMVITQDFGPCYPRSIRGEATISRYRAEVARQAHNLKVDGSIPSAATNINSSQENCYFEILY